MVEPSVLQILLLGLIQGAAELLPVSSSAHVIIAEKLMGLDPSSPEMTFLLVMLHSGTMMAVILYFWNAWGSAFFKDRHSTVEILKNIVFATAATFAVGLTLKKLIESLFLKRIGFGHGQIEDLFSQLPLVASALLVAGLVIILAGKTRDSGDNVEIQARSSVWIGASQGLCLPFRGLSRSGITISTGMLLGLGRQRIEEFSFALAVVITPAVVVQELVRLVKAKEAHAANFELLSLLGPGLLGLIAAFVAGLLALKLLSNWLEHGHWAWFGFYCVGLSGFTFVLASRGF
jgi:undecaprenyl-diphosphatase